MKLKFLSTLSFALLMATCVSLLISCGDDGEGDANDCANLSNQLSTKSTALQQALMENDCEAIENAYNDIIDLYQDGHDCDAYKNAVENAGYDTYNEYIEFLEELSDIQLSDC